MIKKEGNPMAERLTGRTENGNVVIIGNEYTTDENDINDKCGRMLKCFDKLARYEDAEAEGRLVALPCKVGDTVYAPTRNFISEFRVSQFDFGGYYEPYLWVGWYLTKGITGNFRIDGISASEIGKTVFLSREEAEAALERMK